MNDIILPKNIKSPLGTQKPKKMTLIIGMRFKEGVILVSDRKVLESSSNSIYWENKLMTPDPNKQLYVGAADHSNLFKAFNRKIPLIVTERIRETNMKNLALANQLGFETPTEPRPKKAKKIQKSDISKQERPQEETEAHPPTYIYSNEHFIDDASNLIRELCGVGKGSIDVLLIILSDTPRLHHID